MEFIGILLIILVTTVLVNHFCARFGIPAVAGQLVAGVVLGPAVLNMLSYNEFIHYFSEIGVILLMFIAGMESDQARLKKYLKPSFLVAGLGMVFPIVLVYVTGICFGISSVHSLFLGIVFSATSVSISVEVMRSKKVLKTKEGMTLLGAAIVDDVLAVVILSLMTSLNHPSDSLVGLLTTILTQILFFIAVFFIIKWVVPYLMKISSKILSTSARISLALIFCFSLAYLADFVELSTVVGAFFAGLAIGTTKYRQEVLLSIEPIGYCFFIPVFFIGIGLNLSFSRMSDHLLFIGILTIIAILTKLFGAGLGAKLAGYGYNSAYFVGAGMVSRGEMALIMAQTGYQIHLIDPSIYSSVIIIIVTTTILAPFIMNHAVKKAIISY